MPVGIHNNGAKNQLWWDLPAIDTFLLNKEIYEVLQKQYQAVLDELVEMLEVRDLLKVQVRKLSLGQRDDVILLLGFHLLSCVALFCISPQMC